MATPYGGLLIDGRHKQMATRITDFRAIYLPYCLLQLEDSSWVVLNRNYKPVGSGEEDWADYSDIPADIRIARITTSEAALLSHDSNRNQAGRIYLYDDGCNPALGREYREAYLERLAVLMQLRLAGQ